MAKPNTVIAFEGGSQIDHKPIVVLLTGLAHGSSNVKTGAMLQTYILRSDIDPMQALRTGADVSICGGCKQRPTVAGRKRGKLERGCYVQVGQAPMALYGAYQRGRYAPVTRPELAELCRDQLVRVGSYGDPACAPIEVWRTMLLHARGHTGYTHQWRRAKFQAYRDFCVASLDYPWDLAEAKALGWSTFGVVPYGYTDIDPEQVVCPASAEAGKVATCATCLRCDGATQEHVVIQAHGAQRRRVTV